MLPDTINVPTFISVPLPIAQQIAIKYAITISKHIISSETSHLIDPETFDDSLTLLTLPLNILFDLTQLTKDSPP